MEIFSQKKEIVKLEKADWEEAKEVARRALKTILAQKIIYELQYELAEEEIKKYPKEEKKK